MNGFLSSTVRQRRGLRQGDAISPILFNFALEPLLLAILHDNNIQGYSVAARLSKPNLQTTAHRPIKLLAYADDLLVIANTKLELQRIQDHISCYSRASNSRVNYHKSVAFPLSGRLPLIPDDLLRLTERFHFKWFDSTSPTYLRYLGYPIWFTCAQRDHFCNEALIKLQASIQLHQGRAISVYGRAHMVNTLFLSRFWHFLRVTVLPAFFFQKASSLVYQFICHQIFPKFKKTNIYHSKLLGGLSVIDISAQQLVLQQRYISALLYDNSRGSVLPKYLFDLLTSYLQMAYDTFLYIVPLLFDQVRKPSHLNGLHVLSPIIRAISGFPKPDTWDDLDFNLATSLELPFTSLCITNPDLPSVFENASICSKRISYFFKLSTHSGRLSFKERHECQSPNLLNRIKVNYINGTLVFLPFFANFLEHADDLVASDNPEIFDIHPYLHRLTYNKEKILDMSNSTLRCMYLRHIPAIDNIASDLTPKRFKSFLRSNMLSSSRNLWFRLVHGKVSAKANTAHILKLPDDLCIFCGLQETARHLLFTCPAHSELWFNLFILLVKSPNPLDLDQLYNDVISLNLQHYQLLDSSLQVNIFDIISSMLSSIWRAYWRNHFDSIPIDNLIIFDQAIHRIRKLSAFNYI